VERLGLQHRHKELRPETATARKECSEGPRRRTAAISEKTRPEDAKTGKHGKPYTTFRKTTRLGIATPIAGSRIALKRIKKWNLWSGRPSPKRKKHH
jgi:hypothetical protein